jgi:ElaA protein
MPDRARFAELTPQTLYAILRLRVDVFVVEQHCPYPDLDGRDDEPGTVHLWIEEDGRILAYLRVLEEPDGSARIGRVVTAEQARGRGLAARLLTSALEHIGERPSGLHAQAHLAAFYARFGYRTDGPEFLDDGIPHVPMRRP